LTVLRFADVSCARGGRMLFEHMSFALGAGDAALVAGPNGVGKSSLVRIAAGLLRPAGGAVTRDGAVALLGEAHALDPELPLVRALAFWVGMRAEAALTAVGLDHLAAVPVRVLSTGQRRRAGLARVVGADVPIWLLDEPASGLDADGVGQLETLIAAHRQTGGVVVVATHQPIALPDAVPVHLG
jgi:heme exporter protein A